MSIVRIITPDKVSASTSVIIETADGAPVHGVRKATINLEPGKLITATLEVCAVWRGAAKAVYVMADPVSGELKPVHRIEFADGSAFDVTPKPAVAGETE